MELLDIRLNDTVVVEKGGEIIPKVVAVDHSKRNEEITPFVYISHCPECGTLLVRDQDQAKHYCPNDSHCPPQILGRIEHFVSRKAMNINAGESTISFLHQKGLINDAADLYNLKKEDLLHFENWGEKSADNLVVSIKESKKSSFPKVLFAIGIRYVGETTAKTIAEAVRSIDALQQASYEELIEIDEVGERIAKSIQDYFRDPDNLVILEKLRCAGVCFEMGERQITPLSTKLMGSTIVLSGIFSCHRDEMKRLIELHGGKNSSALSASTTYLLAGDKIGPAKLVKAKKTGVPVISEKEFYTIIQ
jgi:DNA ligase (NAD+)